MGLVFGLLILSKTPENPDILHPPKSPLQKGDFSFGSPRADLFPSEVMI